MSKILKILNILFSDEEKEKKQTYEAVVIEKKLENSLDKKELISLSKPKAKKEDAQKFLTVTVLSKYFKIAPAELNTIFANLKWASKEQRWWLVTELGITKGGKQSYNTRNKVKYIQWNENIKEELELINAVQGFKNNKNVKPQTAKEKGDRYEAFIAEYYKELGYFVWEHGKEKGRIDRGIDLIVKKKKEIIFIQCKNWKENSSFQIDHKEVKASRTEARAFMKDNPLFKGYEMKFRYTLSNNCMHPSALKYIEETKGLFDYEVVVMDSY